MIYMVPLVLLICRSYRNRVDAPRFLYWILVAQWFINAFFNMEYTYVCAAIASAFAFLMLTISGTKNHNKR